MTNPIKIGDQFVGTGYPPFIVAEMSGNHNQSLEKALHIVEAAARAGAHAVKLQTYTADTLTIDAEKEGFIIQDPESLWKGKSLYELYKEAYTPWEWHEPIMEKCRSLGLMAFSTPFDETAVDFLETLNVPVYKIASFENNHLPLIRKAASTGKPLIISTGMATIADLDDAVRTAHNSGCKDIILLKCTSTYPAPPKDVNLAAIPHLRKLFGVEIGISDHTLGVGVSIAAVVMGACIVEKHFTLSRAEGGVDAVFSMEPPEMRLLSDELLKAWQGLGKISYDLTPREQSSLMFRRSIYVVHDIKAGEFFTSKNIRIIRPGAGLQPKYYDILIGKRSSRDIQRGEPMKWEFVV